MLQKIDLASLHSPTPTAWYSLNTEVCRSIDSNVVQYNRQMDSCPIQYVNGSCLCKLLAFDSDSLTSA